MYYLEALCHDLNESSWKGSICEIGVGVPFQSMYLKHPGASKTILFTHSPYNKAFQKTAFRSVSMDATNTFAYDDLQKSIESLNSQDYLFSIASSGTHKLENENGQSHGWVTLTHRTSEHALLQSSHFHWTAEKSDKITRERLGEELTYAIAWFVRKILLNPSQSWEDAIFELRILLASITEDNVISIDIIRDRSITREAHLNLVTKKVPLLYHNGRFHRAADYIRKYSRCYRGSFNPPTLAHQSIGDGALFEISLDNARKSRVPFTDIAHRIKMLDLLGHPTLITSGLPLFVDLHKQLLKHDAESMQYLIGVDTFNAIVDDNFIDVGNSDFFSDFTKTNVKKTARFLVLPRDGYTPTKNTYTDQIDWNMLDSNYTNISSTEVRAGKFEYVDERIKEYIMSNNLYS